MIVSEPRSRERRSDAHPGAEARRRRRRASSFVFAVGVALGKALNDAPAEGVVVTSVRTLEPLPQQPSTTAP